MSSYSNSDGSVQVSPIGIVITGYGSLDGMDKSRGKSLSADQNDHLREVVEEVMAKDFMGPNGKINVTRAAKAFGIKQSTLTQFRQSGRGAGPKFIEGFAEYTKYSIDYLYGRTSHKYPVTEDERILIEASKTAEMDKEYPNRARAIITAGKDVSQAAIQQLREQSPATDMTVGGWVDELLSLNDMIGGEQTVVRKQRTAANESGSMPLVSPVHRPKKKH